MSERIAREEAVRMVAWYSLCREPSDLHPIFEHSNLRLWQRILATIDALERKETPHD